MRRKLILIPAYNEESRIAQVIAGVRTAAPDFDILVINDGSKDRTARTAREAGATVASHPFNLGYGVAIQTGYKYARDHGYHYLVQLDGDGQHDPSFIPQLLAPIMADETDFVIGSRFLDGSSYRPSPLRRFVMTGLRLMVSAIIRQPMTDCTSGFQAFNRQVILFFSQDSFPVDYPDADVLICLHRAGFRLKEVPVRMAARAEGKSMHGGLKPFYYLFKMSLSVFLTFLRKPESRAGDA
jgi:glycosyltransferase involved in cell wall biosynthesis